CRPRSPAPSGKRPSMRRIRPTSPASSRHSVPTSGPRRRLRRVTQSQRAADRDQADQGAIGNAPAAVAQRRVCQLRDRDVSARQLGGRIPHIVGSYVRQALKDGLTMQDTKGFNPYKMGFGAAADSHNTAVPYRQRTISAPTAWWTERSRTAWG